MLLDTEEKLSDPSDLVDFSEITLRRLISNQLIVTDKTDWEKKELEMML